MKKGIKMKNILTLMLLGFMFIGCTAKVETDLQPYVTSHQNEVQKHKVNFLGVADSNFDGSVWWAILY